MSHLSAISSKKPMIGPRRPLPTKKRKRDKPRKKEGEEKRRREDAVKLSKRLQTDAVKKKKIVDDKLRIRGECKKKNVEGRMKKDKGEKLNREGCKKRLRLPRKLRKRKKIQMTWAVPLVLTHLAQLRKLLPTLNLRLLNSKRKLNQLLKRSEN